MNSFFIPYFQTTRYRVQAMIDLAQITPGELAADLGSGDGRIVIALAKAGAIAHGYELNEKLIQKSEQNIIHSFPTCHPRPDRGSRIFIDSLLQDTPDSTSLRENDKEKEKIILHNSDFWTENLSNYSIITLYGMPDVMKALEKKLQKELKSGSRVLSNYYPFPTWKETAKKDNIYLYIRS